MCHCDERVSVRDDDDGVSTCSLHCLVVCKSLGSNVVESVCARTDMEQRTDCFINLHTSFQLYRIAYTSS